MNSHTAEHTKDAKGLVVSIQNVSKTFKSDLFKKNFKAIDNLSFDFKSGSCTGLIGHNGAGKTTTIRMMLGLIKPDSGRILFNGMPLNTKIKSRLGYMPEVNRLPLALTVEEALTFHLQMYRRQTHPDLSTKNVVADTLKHVGLQQHRSKKVRQLSKGMARKLSWAFTIIHNPDFLILDEPASGLDPVGRMHMLDWIAQEKAKGRTILLCTHEIAQMKQLCDEIIILKDGHLIHHESFQTCQQHANAFTLHLSGVDKQAIETLKQQESLPDWNTYEHQGYLARLNFNSYEEANLWLVRALSKGIIVTMFADSLTANRSTIDEQVTKDMLTSLQA